MSIAYEINRNGIIKSGEYAGFSINIQYDLQNTGGYLILYWRDAIRTGYHRWVKDLVDLEQFIFESGWDIDWHGNEESTTWNTASSCVAA